MKTIDVKKLNEEIENFINERDWDQFHSVKNLSMAMTKEASELMEIFQWMKEEESNKVKDHPDLQSRVQDEVADVFVYLLRIAIKTGIDLEHAVRQKMIKNSQKYPADKVRGNSRKYNEYQD